MWGRGEIRKEGEGRKEDKKAAEEYFCAEKGKKKKKKNPCGHVTLILLLILTVPKGEPLQPSLSTHSSSLSCDS